MAWSLCTPKGGNELMDFLDKEDPELVIGSSSCDVSYFLKRSNCVLKDQTDLHACARAHARQHQRDKVFLHEAPVGSISWEDRTSHGSHHLLTFSRSKVQFVGGVFAKKM